MPAADRDERIDDLDAGLQRLAHRCPVPNARRTPFDLLAIQCPHRPASVHRSPCRVDNSAQEGLTDRGVDHPVGSPHEAACFDALVAVEQHDADIVDIEIEDLSESAVVEFDQFLIPDPWKSADAGHTLGEALDLASLAALECVPERVPARPICEKTSLRVSTVSRWSL